MTVHVIWAVLTSGLKMMALRFYIVRVASRLCRSMPENGGGWTWFF
jgi:hypothetical protein